MLSKLVGFLCLCMAAHAFAVRDVTLGRVLLDSSTEGSSETTFSSDGGTVSAGIEGNAQAGSGEAVQVAITATAEAIAEVENSFVEIIGEAVAEASQGGNADAAANLSATAIGEAIAETFTEVTGSVRTSSGGDADICISAFALAESTATAYAEVFIDVLLQASNFIAFAEVDAAVRAIASATAAAFSTSEAEACGTVGSLEFVQADLATAVAEPYATVLLVALANVQNQDATAEIDVTVDTRVLEATSISTFSNVEADGTVDGSLQGDSGATTTEDPEVVDSDEETIEADTCSRPLDDCCDSLADECDCTSGSRTCTAEKIEINGQVGYEVTQSGSVVGPDVGEVCVC